MSVVTLGPKKKVPAVPPTFVLRMRLVNTEGKPFADRDYELQWGKKKKVSGKTDADGKLEQKLDAKITKGILDLGEIVDGKFVARISMPVQVATPPEPFKPPDKKKKKPPPPPPTPPQSKPLPMPNSDSSPQDWRRYKENEQEWNDYYEERERYEDQKKKGFPEDDKKPRDFDPKGRPVQPKPDAGKPKLSEKEKKEIEDKLNLYRRQRWEQEKRTYDIAWRLHNLGYLTWPFQPEFPLSGSFLTGPLLDALQRYGQKNGLAMLYESDVMPSGILPREYVEHIHEAHDGKKP